MIARLRDSPLAVTALVAFAIKLWLTSGITIVPLYSPHDAGNFVEHARWIAAGRWFGPYNELTLIKGPTFPIFLALCAEFGIPLPVASEALWFLACYVACVAIRPLVRDERILALGFVALLFNPHTYDDMASVAYRSQIAGSLALTSMSCAFALLLRRDDEARRSLGWAVAFGVAFSAFWLNREEGIWLVPAIAVAILPVGIRAYREARSGSLVRALTLALPLALWGMSIFAICAINLVAYGWATVVEVQSPEFVSAYASLARIAHPPADRRFPVPRPALETAYAVSPAARELRAGFEGVDGDAWRAASCTQFDACGDIAGGWFLWALRGAVADAGHYSSGPEARAFYVRLSREIDQACDAKRLACAPKRHSLVPPIGFGDVPLLVQNFSVGLSDFVSLARFTQEPWKRPPPPPELQRDYLFVTRSNGDRRREIDGRLVAPQAASVYAQSNSAPDPDATLSFSTSAEPAGAARHFTLLTTCTAACSLHVAFARGAGVDIPLTPQTRDLERANLTYHLDAILQPANELDAAQPFKTRLLGIIAAGYRIVVPWLALAGLLVLLSELSTLGTRREKTIADGAIVCASLVLGCTVLIAILTVVQTFSFPGFTPEYLSSCYPLFLLFVVAGLGTRVFGAATVTFRYARGSRSALPRR